MDWIIRIAPVAFVLVLHGCAGQLSATDFQPPEENQRVIVMVPDVAVHLLTADGLLELREDWTNQARENLIAALREQQERRGGHAVVAASAADAGGSPATVESLNRLHDAVGRSIKLHKYTQGGELPTKQRAFDWTLGEAAIDYGRESGYDYALFLHARDMFASDGMKALTIVTTMTCLTGICFIWGGGQQEGFVSLADLRTGKVVWYNYMTETFGDIRTVEGATHMVERLLDDMGPGKQTNIGYQQGLFAMGDAPAGVAHETP